MAARKLWPSNPFAGDLTNVLSPRYNSDGSARVCKSEIIGGGNVGGKLSVVSLAKGRVVEESPCNVKGRSRRRAVSDGSISSELSARRVDFNETSLTTFGGASSAREAERSSS